MNDQKKYQEAKQRASEKLKFYSHLGVYFLVSIMLIIINYTTSSEYLWFKWPLMGWGIAVLIHGLRVFMSTNRQSVLDEMIEREMEKES